MPLKVSEVVPFVVVCCFIFLFQYSLAYSNVVHFFLTNKSRQCLILFCFYFFVFVVLFCFSLKPEILPHFEILQIDSYFAYANLLGKAIDMSFDHKPTDQRELHRIINAGGHVGPDSRVNGGLNLSRAIGEKFI